MLGKSVLKTGKETDGAENFARYSAIKIMLMRIKLTKIRLKKVSLDYGLLFIIFSISVSVNPIPTPMNLLLLTPNQNMKITSSGIHTNIPTIYSPIFLLSIFFPFNELVVYSNINSSNESVSLLPQKFNKSSGHTRRNFLLFSGFLSG
jgi:hypothetical protein